MKLRVDQLVNEHLGRRVSFRRPASSTAGRAQIVGRLQSVRPSTGFSGKVGFNVTIDYHPGALTSDLDEFGPLPPDFPIDIGGVWKIREPREYVEEPVWPEYVKRVRVLFLGGNMDGMKEDIPREDWHSRKVYRQDPIDPEITLTFEQHTELDQVKGALYWGKWRLASSLDPRKHYLEAETNYNWG